MSDETKCPKCRADYDCVVYYMPASADLRKFKCGSMDHVSGRLLRSIECYEAQLAAQQAENERLRAKDEAWSELYNHEHALRHAERERDSCARGNTEWDRWNRAYKGIEERVSHYLHIVMAYDALAAASGVEGEHGE